MNKPRKSPPRSDHNSTSLSPRSGVLISSVSSDQSTLPSIAKTVDAWAQPTSNSWRVSRLTSRDNRVVAVSSRAANSVSHSASTPEHVWAARALQAEAVLSARVGHDRELKNVAYSEQLKRSVSVTDLVLHQCCSRETPFSTASYTERYSFVATSV